VNEATFNDRLLCVSLRRIQAEHLNHQQPFLLTAKSAVNAKRERKDRDGAIVFGRAVSIVSMRLKFLRISSGPEFACPSVDCPSGEKGKTRDLWIR
jgi:hypothetical protein